MTANVGSFDRMLRLVLGGALIVLPFVTSWAVFGGAVMFYGSVIVGAVLALTAVFRFCPLYRILGIQTCRI